MSGFEPNIIETTGNLSGPEIATPDNNDLWKLLEQLAAEASARERENEFSFLQPLLEEKNDSSALSPSNLGKLIGISRQAVASRRRNGEFKAIKSNIGYNYPLRHLQHSPEFIVRLRGSIARRRLLKEDGGMISPSEVAEILGISRQAVGLRRRNGKLLGIEGKRGYIYPVWQFQGKGMVPGFTEVMHILGDCTPLTKMIFFLGGDSAIDYKRPIDLLRKNKIKPVLRAAHLHGVHGCV